jgi:hypothetical protein
MRIDLHSHSRHSDGELPVEGVLARAAAAGVTHLALTDHDTVAGLVEAAAAARAVGVVLVPGIEITADWNGREVHLLGHFCLPAAPGLAAFAAAMGANRAGRMGAIVAKLRAGGVMVALDEVLEEAAGATLGRPHLARVLVRKGYAASLDDAFRRWLGEGCLGDVSRPRPTVAEAAAVVRAAGGTSSLAHPGVSRIGRGEVPDLAAHGVDAIEAFHADHPPSQQEAYARWATAARMEVTGGSDFHGDSAKPHFPMGRFATPVGSFLALSRSAAARQAAPALDEARVAWAAVGGVAASALVERHAAAMGG